MDNTLTLHIASVANYDAARAHMDQRACANDHESIRLGSGGWEVVHCDQCLPDSE